MPNWTPAWTLLILTQFTYTPSRCDLTPPAAANYQFPTPPFGPIISDNKLVLRTANFYRSILSYSVLVSTLFQGLEASLILGERPVLWPWVIATRPRAVEPNKKARAHVTV